MVKIKICGLKRLEDIEIVNRYKPDFIGFVFADSKRKVSHDLAGKLRSNLINGIVTNVFRHNLLHYLNSCERFSHATCLN